MLWNLSVDTWCLSLFFFFFFSRSALVSVCAHGGFLMAFSLAHSDNADAKAELTNLRSSSIKPSVLHKQGARANVLGFFFFFFPRMKEIDPSLWKSNIKGKHGRSYPSFICLFNKTMWSSSHILLKALSETELKKKKLGVNHLSQKRWTRLKCRQDEEQEETGVRSDVLQKDGSRGEVYKMVVKHLWCMGLRRRLCLRDRRWQEWRCCWDFDWDGQNQEFDGLIWKWS